MDRIRRGGSGAEWGGDACVALAGGGTHAQEQDEGDASVPSLHPLHSRPYGNHHPSSFISSFFLDLTPLRPFPSLPLSFPLFEMYWPCDYQIGVNLRKAYQMLEGGGP